MPKKSLSDLQSEARNKIENVENGAKMQIFPPSFREQAISEIYLDYLYQAKKLMGEKVING
jgi:hypothetical protein